MTSAAPAAPTTTRQTSKLFGALTGVATLGVLLQGLWAGLMSANRADEQVRDMWAFVHSMDGNITLLVAIAAMVVAFVKLRERRDLVGGSVVLVVLLAVELGIGEIWAEAEVNALAAVHFPLALLIMAVAVWLPLRHRPRA